MPSTTTSTAYGHALGASAINAALMRNYDKVLHELVPLEAGIYNEIPMATEVGAIGDAHYYFVNTGHNEDAVGTRNYDVAIPTSGRSTQVQASVVERALYADIKIDLRSRARMKGNGSVVKDLAMHEVEDAASVAAKELARMVYCDGTGIRATLTGAGSSETTLTLLKTGGCRASGALYLRPNMSIDSYTAAESQSGNIDEKQISDVTDGTTTDTATIESASWTDGALIYKYNTYTADQDNDWQGLAIASDDGTDFASFAGITVSGASYWKGLRDSASTVRPFDPELMEKLLNRQRKLAGGNVRNRKIISNLGQPSMYWKYMLPSFQVNVDAKPVKYDAGIADAQPFKGIPWKTDVNCPYGTIHVPDFDNFKKWEMKKFGPPDMGLGAKNWTWDSSNRYDAAETYRCMYGNFITTRRQTQLMITDLVEDYL